MEQTLIEQYKEQLQKSLDKAKDKAPVEDNNLFGFFKIIVTGDNFIQKIIECKGNSEDLNNLISNKIATLRKEKCFSEEKHEGIVLKSIKPAILEALPQVNVSDLHQQQLKQGYVLPYT